MQAFAIPRAGSTVPRPGPRFLRTPIIDLWAVFRYGESHAIASLARPVNVPGGGCQTYGFIEERLECKKRTQKQTRLPFTIGTWLTEPIWLPSRVGVCRYGIHRAQ